MSPDTVSHIFEPFFSTKGPAGGRGLGLASVYGAVKQNGGFIHVESEIGKGTAFSIYLPRCDEGESSGAGEMHRPKEPRRVRVLVVEDEPAVLAMNAKMLGTLGYDVRTASTPKAAIALFEEEGDEIDVLLTDVVMPQMSGRDLAAHLESLRPDLKCVFMSGYPADVIGQWGVLEGGMRFLQKPFTRQDLAEGMRRALETE